MLGCGPQVQTARSNGVLEITYDQCAKGGEVEYYRVSGIGAYLARREESAAGKMGRQAERQPERDRRHLGIFQGASADAGVKPIAKND